MKPRTRYAPEPVRPFLLRYGMAAAITMWVLLIMKPVIGLSISHPFGVLLGAVALSAWYGGMGPGLLTAIAGAMVGFYGHHAANSDQFLQMGFYLVAALSIGALADRRDTAEAALRASRDELGAVLWCVADGLCAVAGDGRILYENEAFARADGSLASLVGPTAGDLFDLYDASGQAMPFECLPVPRVLSGETQADTLVRARERKTGWERWLLIRAKAMPNPIAWDAEAPERVAVCVIQDFTDREQAESDRARLLLTEREARQNAERNALRLERLNAVAVALSRALTSEQVADVVIREGLSAIGAEHGLLYAVDPGGEGLTLMGMIGECPSPIPPWIQKPLVPTPISDAFECRCIVWCESREALMADYTHLQPGVPWPTRGARVALPLVVDERVLGVIYVIYEEPKAASAEEETFLTALAQQCAQALERARLYTVEQAARAEAERSARAMDEFLAMLSHEIRNPLGSVVNATTLLRRLRGSDPDLSEPLDVLNVETRQITRIVNDLLDVSRITRGKIALVREPEDLVTVTNQAIRCVRPMLEARQQQLFVSSPTEPVTVLLDQARMEQVIGNLLSNASKYSDEGAPVELRIGVEGAEAVVRVIDHGVGVDPAFLPHVFDLFSQADRSLDRSGGGLGIGLTLVKRLVEMHDGTVEARSGGSGRGSEFIVRLPLAGSPDAEKAPPDKDAFGPQSIPVADAPQIPAADAPQNPDADAISRCGHDRHRRRVLVVDDNKPCANLLVKLLTEAGHEACSANMGEVALRLAPDFRPDTILLDIGLPGMDGYEVARRLQAEPSLGRLRLIALTGYGQPEDRDRTHAAGFHAHLTKPIDYDALLDLLDGTSSPGV